MTEQNTKVQEVTEGQLKEIIDIGLKESALAGDVAKLSEQLQALQNKQAVSGEERAEASRAFVKDLFDGNVDNLRTKTVTTASGSMGYTVPTELQAAVHEKKDKIAKIRSRAFVFQLNGPFDVPTEGTGVTAYWVTTEADSDLTESNPTVETTLSSTPKIKFLRNEADSYLSPMFKFYHISLIDKSLIWSYIQPDGFK